MMKKVQLLIVLLYFSSLLGDHVVAGFQGRSFALPTATHSGTKARDGSVMMMMVVVDRRTAIAGISTLAGGLFPELANANDAEDVEDGSTTTTSVGGEKEDIIASDIPPTTELEKNTMIEFTTYNIIPDASDALDPKLIKVDVS